MTRRRRDDHSAVPPPAGPAPAESLAPPARPAPRGQRAVPGKFRPSLVDRLLELVDEDLAALVAKPDATVLIGRPLAPRLEALRGALLACSYEASVRVRIRDGVYEWRTTRRVDADAFAEDVVDAVAAAYGLTREPLEP